MWKTGMQTSVFVCKFLTAHPFPLNLCVVLKTAPQITNATGTIPEWIRTGIGEKIPVNPRGIVSVIIGNQNRTAFKIGFLNPFAEALKN
jgi:hypothetical protein